MKTELSLKNIQTNRLKDEAIYILENSFRTTTGQIKGIELVESNCIFEYLGNKYYLTGDILTDHNGNIIIDQYNRHFENNGNFFIESKNNSLYKLITNTIILQSHKFHLYEDKTYFASITKNNIPYLGTEKEICYLNNKGEVFLINFEEGYFCHTSIEGQAKEKINFDLKLTNEKLFFLKAKQGIEFISFDNSTIKHYQILDQSLSIKNEIAFTHQLLEANILDDKLALIYEKEKEILFLQNDKEIKIADSYKEIITNKFNSFEKETIEFIKIDVVENGTVRIGNDTKTIYKLDSKTIKLNKYKIEISESNTISKIENNKIISYIEYIIKIDECTYESLPHTAKYCIGKKQWVTGSAQGWEFNYMPLTKNEPRIKIVDTQKIIVSVSSVWDIKKESFDLININTKKVTIHLEDEIPVEEKTEEKAEEQKTIIDYKKAIINLSSVANTIDYFSEDKIIKSRLILLSYNYPIEKTILEYIGSKFKIDLVLESIATPILFDYQRGQEQFLHDSIKIENSISLEFMQGNIYFNSYHNLVIKNDSLLSEYEGKRAVVYKALDEKHVDKEIAKWEMQSPFITYNKNMSIYVFNGTEKYTLTPSPIKKIHKYAFGGQFIYIVYEADKRVVNIQNFNKQNQFDFIGTDSNIEEIEATSGGTFIASINGISFLRTVSTGNGIEQYLAPKQLDTDVLSIGKDILFLYGENIIYYIRDNDIKAYEWKIKEAPILAMKKENYYLIQTEDNKIYLLSLNTGELSLFSKSKELNFTLDYQIKHKETAYFLKSSNPTFSFSWSQDKVRIIRKITSKSKIIKAIINNKERKVFNNMDENFVNCNEIMGINMFCEITFEKQIGSEITIETI